MIEGRKVLGLITARGGSKGAPGKNTRMVGGKPLIAWTIESGLACRTLDRLILSSDDDAIMKVARDRGCEVPFKREARLATDEASSMDVVFDALDRCPGYDWVVLLQPTSPLRRAEDIEAAIERCVAFGAPACVSVCAAAQSPYWMYTLQRGDRLSPLLPSSDAIRRQDLPPVYFLNGAVYAADTTWLATSRNFVTSETVAYEMPIERSLDIDTEADLARLGTLIGIG